jgi:hemerythrin-like domain-containing protein
VRRKNQDIKSLMRSNKVYTWEVASQINVHENTLYRWLRNELSEETRQRIIIAIQNIIEEGKEFETEYGQ